MDVPPPNLNAPPPNFNPNVPPPSSKCPVNYMYRSHPQPYPQYSSYYPYNYNTQQNYTQGAVTYSPHLPPPTAPHTQLPVLPHNLPPMSHSAAPSTIRASTPSSSQRAPPPKSHMLPMHHPQAPGTHLPPPQGHSTHLPPPQVPSTHLPPPPPPHSSHASQTTYATDPSAYSSLVSTNYYGYSCPPPPGCFAPQPTQQTYSCPPPAPPPPPSRHRVPSPYCPERPAVPPSPRNTALIQIELKKSPRTSAYSQRRQSPHQDEQDGVKRSSSLPNINQKSTRSARSTTLSSVSSSSRAARRRSQESDRTLKAMRLQSKNESERDRLLKTWRSQYCETSEEITRKLAELANNEEKEVWIRSSPAELYYTRTNNGNEVESTARLDTLCQVFEDELVKRSEKIKTTQEPYNPPPRARKKRLCRHKCK